MQFMDNAVRAQNFETLCLATEKSPSNVIPVFDLIGSLCNLDEKLTDNIPIYSKASGVDAKALDSAFRTVSKSFEQLDERVEIIGRESVLWPHNCKEAAFLYILGNRELLAKPGISVVGTRNPSQHGISMAREAVGVLDKKYVIVSGMAMGIDGVSHIQALADGKSTLAVLGTPINKVYPKEHEKLQSMVAEKGLLVSQFAPCTEVKKYFFMQRNLLMSQISKATLVVESSDGGGGVREAEYTAKQGKPVFVMKEIYDNRAYLWPRTLQGVEVVKNAREIISKLENPVADASPQLDLF